MPERGPAQFLLPPFSLIHRQTKRNAAAWLQFVAT